MTITGMSDRVITVYRKTAVVIDAVVASGAIAIDRQNTKNAMIEVEIGGTGFVAGTVTVAGDIDGAPDTEVLSFTASGTVKTTRKRFDAGTLTAFSSTLPGTVTVLARAVGAGGDRLNIASTVITGWPARFDRGRGRWRNQAQGTQQVEQTRFYVDYTTVWDPREGDTIVNEDSLEEFLVIGVPDLHGARRIAHHWEIEVRRREQSSTT